MLRFPPDLPSGIMQTRRRVRLKQLRFPPDLPSGIIMKAAVSLPRSCGSPPISHRV